MKKEEAELKTCPMKAAVSARDNPHHWNCDTDSCMWWIVNSPDRGYCIVEDISNICTVLENQQ